MKLFFDMETLTNDEKMLLLQAKISRNETPLHYSSKHDLGKHGLEIFSDFLETNKISIDKKVQLLTQKSFGDYTPLRYIPTFVKSLLQSDVFDSDHLVEILKQVTTASRTCLYNEDLPDEEQIELLEIFLDAPGIDDDARKKILAGETNGDELISVLPDGLMK